MIESAVKQQTYHSNYSKGYSNDVDVLRDLEYPNLKETTYLDHAATTPYAKSLIEAFSRDLTGNLFGNPHSASLSSQLTTHRIDDIRLRTLQFFKADPEVFDLVFVANATAGIKLVAEALRDSDESGFWYGYHIDSHTSLVGVRGLADCGRECMLSDEEADRWIADLGRGNDKDASTRLFAYPAQSNMTGRRLPLRWCKEIRDATRTDGPQRTFTLLDVASLVSTSPFDLSDPSVAPDFAVLSFYKIFGFPDLGALIVRKDAGHVFQGRRYFGGGTVDMVVTHGDQWHAKKESSVHDKLEDGTLPFHNIIALDSALRTHCRLYGSMENISAHTRFLADELFKQLSSKVHWNGRRVCHIFTSSASSGRAALNYGPVITFNLQDSRGRWVGKSEVEKMAAVKNIQIRSGTLCNPGGMTAQLGLGDEEMKRNFAAGQRCGDDNDIIDGKPTGALRVSLGAMTNMRDIEVLLAFIDEFYVEKVPELDVFHVPVAAMHTSESHFYVESLCVYPIKSCGSFKVPSGQRWEIKREGLTWDREWCLIHQGTGVALNQKRYPRMALIHPYIDLNRGVLRITLSDHSCSDSQYLEVSLTRDDPDLIATEMCRNSTKKSTVCGDSVTVQVYSSPSVSTFFSEFLGVPCTLARFPPQTSPRYSKPRRPFIRRTKHTGSDMPGSFPERSTFLPERQNPILLSNESPILLISRSSVNRLNETIKATSKNGNRINRAVAADVFRANVVVAENTSHNPSLPSIVEQPYAEDNWTSLCIGPENLQFDVLGHCQRCQMVCIDQLTATRSEEPFATLAKTRKVDGKVVFGRHMCLSANSFTGTKTIMVGDAILPS
ncbi:molybdenum cofactor sulfurase protein (HxB), putative [Paecilomyces variotii No. 5]|uniref:Molybdenum cofactor sulfurase n=1 Tax=Byssochlamys spectabilis (strain No. 5 / NBRC 109023) TaxID=1356009 RepID=V5FK43_BYSSN|nr:molybdenum cofactor sulfurase protein (HxB), putative [Paecilomyces variotii No. 5]